MVPESSSIGLPTTQVSSFRQTTSGDFESPRVQGFQGACQAASLLSLSPQRKPLRETTGYMDPQATICRNICPVKPLSKVFGGP